MPNPTACARTTSCARYSNGSQRPGSDQMHRGDREAQRENQITKRIIGFAMTAYRALGRGLVECAHEEYLWYELTRQGIPCSRQLPLSFRYKGVMLDCGDRMD